MLNQYTTPMRENIQNTASITRLGRVLPAQMTIYHQGDPYEGVYRVNSGVVMVYRLLDNCERQIFGFYTRGDYFGMCAGTHHEEAALTVKTSNITLLKMADIIRDTKLTQNLLTVTCEQLAEAQDRVAVLTRKNAAEKMAYFLVKLAERKKDPCETFNLNLPMSRLDIADYLGMTIETVSRRLTALKVEGVITLPDRDTVKICNYARLKEIAGET